MRRLAVITLTVSVLVAAPRVAAQAPDHPLLGARVEIESQTGLHGKRVRQKGEVVEVSAESVILRTADGIGVVPLATIVGLKQRRATRQTLRGLLLGDAIATAALGDRTDSDAILMGLAAAGVGAALGSRISLQEFQRTRVATLRETPMVGSIVRISRRSGGHTEGLLLRSTGDSLVVEQKDGGRVIIPALDVREVQWASGLKPPSFVPPLILGALGAVVGYAATTGNCRRTEWLCFEGLGAIPGYLIGTGIGYGISLSNRSWRWEESGDGTPLRIGLLPMPGGAGVGLRLEF